MSLNDVKTVLRASASDDKPFFLVRRDFSGGVNTRGQAGRIQDTQSVTIENFSLDTLGQLTKRLGGTLISDDMGSASVVGLFDYQRQGYTDQLLIAEDNNLNASESEGNHTEIKGDFTASQTDIGFVQAKESGLTPDDVVFVNFGGNNWWRIHKDSTGSWDTQDLGSTAGTGSDSPPPASQ